MNTFRDCSRVPQRPYTALIILIKFISECKSFYISLFYKSSFPNARINRIPFKDILQCIAIGSRIQRKSLQPLDAADSI